jgi:hypothetical protein
MRHYVKLSKPARNPARHRITGDKAIVSQVEIRAICSLVIKGAKMSESGALRYSTIVAAVAASIAALAASAQSYVAWSGRNDSLKATLVAAAVQQCSDLSLVSQKIFSQYKKVSSELETGLPADGHLFDEQLIEELQAKILQAWLVLSALDPKEQMTSLSQSAY